MENVKSKLRTEVTANWERIPRVTGRIVRIDSQEVTNARGEEIVPYLLVDTKDRFVRVYKSAALEELFEHAALGDMVDVESIGMRTTKSGNQCRQFDVHLWTDASLPPVVESVVRNRRGNVAEETESGKSNAAKRKTPSKR